MRRQTAENYDRDQPGAPATGARGWRSGLVWVSATFLIFSGGSLALAQQKSSQKPHDTATPSKSATKPVRSELEQLLLNAMQNNPDIRVSEAKVREAEAELNRTRIQVLQKVSTLYSTIEAQKTAIARAQVSLDRVNRLLQNKAVGPEELQQTEATLTAEKSKLASAESEMTGLLGKMPANQTAWDIRGQVIWNPEGSWHQVAPSTIDVSGALWQQAISNANNGWISSVLVNSEAAKSAPSQAPVGSMAERIRKALDTPVKVEYKRQTHRQILNDLKNKAASVPIYVRIGTGAGDPVDFDLGEVPLGAALQAFADFFEPDLRFVVREYGILVTHKDLLPAGAVLLHDFWRREKGHEVAQSVPSQNVEGLIKAVDPQSGFVTITLGNDAGLAKDNALEVYRLKPEPRYLGSVKIIEVRPNEAVAKPMNSKNGPLQIGDRVAPGVLRR
jgi:hypothetical protein